MKNLNGLSTALATCVLFAATGCSDEPKHAVRDASKTTPAVSETERPGSNLPSDIQPVTARLRISDLKVGTAIAGDGTVAENVNLVKAGDSVHASIAVGDVGADSLVKAVWLGPNGARIADEIQPVKAGAAFLVFHAPETSTWAVGEYKVEIFLGDELAASDSFDIVGSNPA